MSTANVTQTETQCEDAVDAVTTPQQCDTSDPDPPGYSLTQTQYGPEGVFKAPKHRRGRVPFVHKGVGQATQTGNSGDTFTINQSSKQDNDTGSGQTNNVQGDCHTSGSCTNTQKTNINGNQSDNTQTGPDLNTSLNCTGASCSARRTPARPPNVDSPPDPSRLRRDAGVHRHRHTGDGTGSIAVSSGSAAQF